MPLSTSGWPHNTPRMEEIQPFDPAQVSRVLALNNEHAEELSWLDADRLAA